MTTTTDPLVGIEAAAVIEAGSLGPLDPSPKVYGSGLYVYSVILNRSSLSRDIQLLRR